jgi:hypothetical protein
MATVSGISRNSILWNAALAVVFVVQATPARSEILDFSCVGTGEGKGLPVTVKVDTERRTWMEVGLAGASGETISPSFAAVISEQFITYEGAGDGDYLQRGILDRVTGIYNRTVEHKVNYHRGATSYRCRRDTKFLNRSAAE